MTPQVRNEKTPAFVMSRFPHLASNLHRLVTRDEGFRQLCSDYQELMIALKHKNSQSGDTREELLRLKTSLEVEILEQVTRKQASIRR